MNYKISKTLYSDYSGWIKVVTPYDTSIKEVHSLEICKHIKYSKFIYGDDKFIRLKIIRKVLDFEVKGSYMIYSFFVKQEDKLNIRDAFMSHDTEVNFIIDHKNTKGSISANATLIRKEFEHDFVFVRAKNIKTNEKLYSGNTFEIEVMLKKTLDLKVGDYIVNNMNKHAKLRVVKSTPIEFVEYDDDFYKNLDLIVTFEDHPAAYYPIEYLMDRCCFSILK